MVEEQERYALLHAAGQLSRTGAPRAHFGPPTHAHTRRWPLPPPFSASEVFVLEEEEIALPAAESGPTQEEILKRSF